MAETPKLDSETEQNMLGCKKTSMSETEEAFEYEAEKSDSFVIDMDAFPHANNNINKDSNTTSRITLQRSLSRKRCSDKMVNVPSAVLRDWDSIPTLSSPNPRDLGSCTPEKVVVPALGSTNHCSSPQVHHQITITAGNIATATATATINEGRNISRRNSFKRHSSNWGFDPKRVLLLFATLSSMGSMLLIYLTLAISNEQNYND